METDVLRWFQQVADGITITEISDLEPVTQSGISRALARLDVELGTPLLRRSGRTLRMTHAGAVFKRHVDALLHDLDDGLAAVNQLVDPERGTVELAFQQSFGTWLVPHLVSTFQQAHPDVTFVYTQVRDDLLPGVLDGGGVDMELGTRRPHDTTVHTRLLGVEPLRLAVPRHHRLARRKRVRLAELAGDPFVTVRPQSALRQLCDQLCRDAGFGPNVVFEGNDLSTVRGFVSAGLGVAIVPAPRDGTPESAVGPLRYCDILDDGAVREIRLMWPVERRLLPAAELFRQHVCDLAAADLLPPVSVTPHRADPRS